MFKKMLSPLFLLGFVLILWQQAMAAPDTPKASIVVNSTADTQANDGQCTLREAMINANNDSQFGSTDCTAGSGADTITFIMTPPATIMLSSELPSIVSGSVITITGPGPDPNGLVLDGLGASRALYVSGGSLTLNSLTVTGGFSTSPGGGLSVDSGGTVNIINSTFSGNTAGYYGGYGGGLSNDSGNINITNSTFSNNSVNNSSGYNYSSYGGGIYNTSSGTVNITNSTFSNNSANNSSSYAGAVSGGGAISSTSGTVTITDSTFSDNSADSSSSFGSGGGISASGTVNITNSIFSNNSANSGGSYNSSGGGLSAFGSVNITNSTFSNNIANGDSTGSGGGVYAPSGTVNITNSTFSNNSANGGNGFQGSGGGIFASGTVNITNSTFSNNNANGNSSSDGGGISTSGTVDITGSTFSGNMSAGDGGGLRISSTAGNIVNSTFSGNISAGNGGGLLNSGTLAITNSTFSGNGASSPGGNLYNDYGTLTLANSILANSAGGGDCAYTGGTITDNGGNLVEDLSCGFPDGVDPMLGPLADNGGPTLTHALLLGSPALDTAILANCPPTDQRNVPRPQGSGCDMGAFELETATPTPPTPTNTPSPTPTFTPTPTLTPTPPAPGGPIFLPIIIRPVPCFAGSEEVEPNNSASEATGPLCLNQNYLGTPDDNWDFFSFTLNSPDVITIDVTNHPLASETGAQVQLYYQTVSPGTKVGEALILPYQIIYDGAAGTYYVLIFNDTDKCNPLDCSVQYTLRVSSE